MVAELRPLKEAKKSKRSAPFTYPEVYNQSLKKETQKTDLDETYQKLIENVDHEMLKNIFDGILQIQNNLVSQPLS